MIIEVKKDPRYKVSIKAIKVIAEKVLIEFGLDDKTELSIIFVGKRKAKKLNETYRQMDYIPEVLSFPSDKEITPTGNLFLGDIMICFPLARDRAMIENQLMEKSIEELLRHGIGNLVNS